MASVSGVALLGASRSRYDGLILVPKSLNLAGLGMVAVLAILLLGSRYGASRFHRDIPVAVGVTQSIGIAIDVGVAASTGMGGIALFGTSRSRYDGLILVPKSLNLAGLGMVAVLAILLLGSRYGASRFHRDIPVAVGVTQSIGIAIDVGVAAVAGVSGVALLGTGGGSDSYFVGVRMGPILRVVGNKFCFNAIGNQFHSGCCRMNLIDHVVRIILPGNSAVLG